MVRVDGHELDAEFLDTLDESDKMRLICHVASQHRRTRESLQLHAVEQDSKRIAQLPTKDQPVTSWSHPFVVHFEAALHSGGQSVITFVRIHLGETDSRQSRPSAYARLGADHDHRQGRQTWTKLSADGVGWVRPGCPLEKPQFAAAFKRIGPRRHGKLAVDRPDVAVNRVMGNIQFTTDISL